MKAFSPIYGMCAVAQNKFILILSSDLTNERNSSTLNYFINMHLSVVLNFNSITSFEISVIINNLNGIVHIVRNNLNGTQ